MLDTYDLSELATIGITGSCIAVTAARTSYTVKPSTAVYVVTSSIVPSSGIRDAIDGLTVSFLAVALSHLISIVQLITLPAGLVFCELFPESSFPELLLSEVLFPKLLLSESLPPDTAFPLLLSDSLPPEPELLSVTVILSVEPEAELSSETVQSPVPSKLPLSVALALSVLMVSSCNLSLLSGLSGCV